MMRITKAEWDRKARHGYTHRFEDGGKAILQGSATTGGTELVPVSVEGEDCEICGTDIRRDRGRCTNERCSSCHAKHCTPGGATSPGHGRRWPEAGAR